MATKKYDLSNEKDLEELGYYNFENGETFIKYLLDSEDYILLKPGIVYKGSKGWQKEYEELNTKWEELNTKEEFPKDGKTLSEKLNSLLETLPEMQQHKLLEVIADLGIKEYENKQQEVIDSNLKELGLDIYIAEKNNPQLKPGNTKTINSVNWQGSQTETMELVKALIEAGKIKGTQKDIVKSFSQFFGIEIKYPDKILQDIKSRKNEGETLFLDKLKEALLDYLKK